MKLWKSRKQRAGAKPAILRILAVLVVIFLAFSALEPAAFFTLNNVVSILLASSGIFVLSVGMTVLIVAGQLDLSIGSQLVVCAAVSAAAMQGFEDSGWPAPVAVAVGALIAIAVGGGFGLVNGLAVTRLKVPSLVVTLGTLAIGLGLAQMLTSAGGSTSAAAPTLLTEFGLSDFLGIPSVVWIAFAVGLLVAVVLSRTRFGLHCYAVGSNREGARRVGVPADRVVISAFVLMGVLSGVAAMIDLSRFSTVSVAGHQFDNVTAIAAVIIGGASLYGGRGTVVGTSIGTVIPVVLLQGFVILNVNPSWQNVAIGAVLVAAVAFDQYDRTSRRARAEARAIDAEEYSASPSGAPPQPSDDSARPSGVSSPTKTQPKGAMNHDH